MDDTKLLLLADKFRRLRDRVDGLSVKQDEIQTITGDQGPKGEQGDRGFDGAPGKDGDDGADGTDGQDGKDGVSVVNAEIAFDGSLVIYLSDGREIDCGEVVREIGDTVIQTLKQGAAVSGGGGVTSITSTDGSVVVTDVAGVVDLAINVFTSAAKGVVPASGGGTTNFLRADGTFAAPPSGAPASPTTSVQFNNAGAFGGASTFTYASGTDTLSVGKLVSANFTDVAQGLVPASGGGTANFLRADGTFAAPTATVTPAGADTQIQYNNAGVLGANANFTYSSSLNTLSLGPQTGTATFTTRAPTTAQNPGALVIAAQSSIRTSTTSPGGALTLLSGNGRPTGPGAGGAVSITSGNAGTTGAGGAINITTGNGGTTSSGNGGQFNVIGGSGVQGGTVAYIGGNGSTLGGGVSSNAGGNTVSFSSGGRFVCTGGTLTDGGGVFFIAGDGPTGGNVELRPGFGGPSNGFVTMNNYFSDSGVKVSGLSGAPTLGFYGTAPVVKPTVTGSRASGAALQDLLTKLASLGLITDSTTI